MKILLINPSYGKINKCWWLWRAPQVNADGGITPCCYKVEKSSDFGDVSKNSFKDIWNDENCASARNLFLASILSTLNGGFAITKSHFPVSSCGLV